MVLDPLTYIGLAASVVQFVVFGYQILSKGNEIYSSADGTLKENSVVELVIKDLKGLVERIQVASPSSSADPVVYSKLRNESLKVADELTEALEKLKVKGAPSKWKSLRKALKSACGKEKIEALVKRLDMLRAEFSAHVEVDILESVNLLEVSQSENFHKLEQQQRDSIQAFIDAQLKWESVFDQGLDSRTQSIIDANREEHEKTRSAIASAHANTVAIVEKGTEVNLSATTKQAFKTRNHVSAEHDKTHTLISSTFGASVESNKAEHLSTRMDVADSTDRRVRVAEQNIDNDNRDRIDFLEAELYRSQLQNESNLYHESQRTREAIEMSNFHVFSKLEVQQTMQKLSNLEIRNLDGPASNAASTAANTSPMTLLIPAQSTSCSSQNDVEALARWKQNTDDRVLWELSNGGQSDGRNLSKKPTRSDRGGDQEKSDSEENGSETPSREVFRGIHEQLFFQGDQVRFAITKAAETPMNTSQRSIYTIKSVIPLEAGLVCYVIQLRAQNQDRIWKQQTRNPLIPQHDMLEHGMTRLSMSKSAQSHYEILVRVRDENRRKSESLRSFLFPDGEPLSPGTRAFNVGGSENLPWSTELSIARHKRDELGRILYQLKDGEVLFKNGEWQSEDTCFPVLEKLEPQDPVELVANDLSARMVLAPTSNSSDSTGPARKYRCDHAGCDESFDTQMSFDRHRTEHDRKYTCDACNCSFVFFKDLRRHANGETHCERLEDLLDDLKLHEIRRTDTA